MASKWATMAAQREEDPLDEDKHESKWKAMKVQRDAAGGKDESMSWVEALTSAAVNAPKSAYDYAKNIYEAVRHPVVTAKAVGRLGLAGAQKLASQPVVTPAGQVIPIPGAKTGDEEIGAVIGAMKERYGSVENFKRTLSVDPIGVMADASSIVTPGGLVGAQRLGKVGAMLDPVTSVPKLARRSVGKAYEGVSLLVPKINPSELYQSAVKFSTVLPAKTRAKLVNTALDRQVMPTYNGLRKLSAEIETLNNRVSDLIDASVETGRTIPVDRLFSEFDTMKNKLLRTSSEPITSSGAFDSVKKEIVSANERIGRTDLTPLEAQKMKQRIYRELDNEYSRVALTPPKKEARMAVAKNLRLAIEEIVPEVKMLNRTEGELIELQRSIERVASRIANRDILSLGATAKAAGGGAIAGGYGLAAGLAVGLLDSQPVIKSKLALVLHKLRSKGIRIRPTATATRLGLYQSGKLKEEFERHGL